MFFLLIIPSGINYLITYFVPSLCSYHIDTFLFEIKYLNYFLWFSTLIILISQACVSPAFCQLKRLSYTTCLRPLSLEGCPRRSLLLTTSLGLFLSMVLAVWLTCLCEQSPFKLKDAFSGLVCLIAPSKASLVGVWESSYCEFRLPVAGVSLCIVATAVWCHS